MKYVIEGATPLSDERRQMKFTMTVNMDNDAFVDLEYIELARLLHQLADDLSHGKGNGGMIHIKPWKRVVTPGTVDVGRAARVPLFVEIEWQHSRNNKWELSICGVEGPWGNGNCAGSCGQCREALLGIRPYPNWDRSMARTLYEYWDRWHMNGMRAGSPAQESHLREIKHEYPDYPASWLGWARGKLAEAGLEPDPTVLSTTKFRERVIATGVGETAQIERVKVFDVPYSYGSSWLYEEVPEHVLDWLYRLPTAQLDHPWGYSDRFLEEEATA